jgi:hypothetical protein
MTMPYRLAAMLMMGAALAGCKRGGDLVLEEGVGITAVRTACPAVGVPDYTGDVTTFRMPGDTSAANIDVSAEITNLRFRCDDGSPRVYTSADFDVYARRTDTRGARTVTLPYYAVVLRGGTSVVTKRIGQAVIQFADGQERAQGHAQAGAYVDRAEATLPPDIRDQITRKRKPGAEDAALDPLADPTVKAAVARATFELLIGFQLTEQQLAYNATR